MSQEHSNQTRAQVEHYTHTKLQPTKMDFYGELANEIGANDWLIPAHEISNRKLIKQTPRYNIYRADWFGDVLVYKPSATCNTSQKLGGDKSSLARHRLNLDYVREFCKLSVNGPETRSLAGCSDDYEPEQTDSAYSSISSTPQYHTKSTGTEFEFPAEARQLGSATDDQYSTRTSFTENTLADAITRGTSNVVSPTPVLLNGDSFNYNCCLSAAFTTTSDNNNNNNSAYSTTGSWSDLNELRLIAHENFMLFMGASIGAQEDEGASLVMQMSHPKAATVYNLLHKAKLELNSSPIDRFFASKRQQINLEVKLRVCQQVTDAMAYLHDKNIVHGHLTSGNIYVELNQRVKISLIDSDEQSVVVAGSSCQRGAEFHLPALTYLSPEFIRTITIISTTAVNHNKAQNACCCGRSAQVKFDHTQLTREADVFSFGTFLFELFRESFPFAEQVQDISCLSKTHYLNSPLFSNNSGATSAIRSPFESALSQRTHWNGDIKLSASELIYQIGAGNVTAKNLSKTNSQLEHHKFPLKVQRLVEECWSTKAQLRPSFKQLAAKFLTLQPAN